MHSILQSSALVYEVNPPRDPSRSPLFDVMFVLQTTDTAAGNLPAFFLPGSGAQLTTAQSGLQLQAEQGPRLLALWERPRFVWSLQGSDPDSGSIKQMLSTMASWTETSRLGLLHTVNEQQITHPPQTLERKELKRSSLLDEQQGSAWFPEGDQAALIHWS